MILFYSDGRLGNQIFQISFIREILKPGEKVISFNLGRFLDVFDIDFKIDNIEIKNKLLKFVSRKLFVYSLELLSFFGILSIIYEDVGDVSYKKKKGLFHSIVYVRTGFFQSEKFFNRCNLLKEIRIKKIFRDRANNFLKFIPEDFTKIFIHVRRGDYLKEVYKGVRGINLPLDYYIKAIDIVKNVISNPYFIILSDDYEFVSNSFLDLENKIISREDFATDLAIMSYCDGGIVSNSSYSWWGAFLLENREIVIMPRYWYGWRKKIQSHRGINLSFAKVIDF